MLAVWGKMMCERGECCWHDGGRKSLSNPAPIGYAVYCIQHAYGHNLLCDRSNETAAEVEATFLDITCPCGPHFVREVYG